VVFKELSKNQSEFLGVTCNLLKAREKSTVQGSIDFGFGFASPWLENWHEIFDPIIKAYQSQSHNLCR